jgi:hypothetical protein
MDVLNSEDKGRLLEALKKESADGKTREIIVNHKPVPHRET